MNKYSISSLVVLASIISCPAKAADVSPSQQPTPLEITADKALEWDQAAKTYTARGNALAKQNDLSVKADTLIAYYDDADGSANNIVKLVAEGNVILISGTDRVTSDKAVYDLVKGQGDITGSRPKITRANNDSLEADSITIWTTSGSDKTSSAKQLDRAEATGNVLITNTAQKATSDRAKFTSSTNIAELFGHVKIEQDKNWLTGDYADMNLTTRISHVKTDGTSKQVKGTFYSKSAALPTSSKPTQAVDVDTAVKQ